LLFQEQTIRIILDFNAPLLFLSCGVTKPLQAMGVGRFFFQGQQWIFPGVNQKHFSSEQQWLNIILPTQN